MYSFLIREDEHIIKKSHASLHSGSDAWSGAFYLTNHRLVFVGYMMDINKKFLGEIPLREISEVAGGKTFFVIPNVIDITTCDGYRWKVIIEGRKAWLAAIREELGKLG